jgi:hypothetical protein
MSLIEAVRIARIVLQGRVGPSRRQQADAYDTLARWHGLLEVLETAVRKTIKS